MLLEQTFDMNAPPFQAESLDAMVRTILGFCEAKGSSVLTENISDHEIRVYIDEKKSEKAQRNFLKAAEQCNMHKFNSARFTLNDVLKLWPFHSEAYRLLAQVYMEMGKVQEAINVNIEALRFDPKNLWALILMGNIYTTAKQNAEVADTYFSKVLEYYPDNAVALNNLGGVYCKRGQYTKGTELFKKALEVDPTSSNSYYGLALTRFRQKDYTGAFDWAMEGLAKGAERPENMQMRPLLIQLARDSAEKVEDDPSLLSKAVDVSAEISQKYNTVVKMEKDENQPFMAHLEFADFYRRDYHIIKYKTEGHFVHLVLHELMHLEMMLEAKAAGKLLQIGFKQENFELFLDQFHATISKVADMMGDEKAQNFARQLFTGISQQLLNNPLDLFVEKKIYEQHPQFRAAQFSSLYSLEEINLKAIEDARDSAYIPAQVKVVSRSLNMISSTFMEEHYHCGMLRNYTSTADERTFAQDWYERFQNVWKNYTPGAEYDLFLDMADVMKMRDYFSIKNFAEGLQSIDDKIETEAERQQRIFDERHGKDDEMVNMMMSQYMLAALMAFDKMDLEEIRDIARECAIKGMNGISVSGDDAYTLKAFPGKQFSGYEFLAYYYVSWALGEPDKLLDTGLPFHKAYAMARQMWEKRQ